mgnify:CR=1 FL=1
MKSIELLAPAKDLQAAVAAVDYGADALYIGGARFGARHAAGNSAEEIARAVEYAHQYGVRVHATLNTLLYDGELAEAERQARELIAAGRLDGVEIDHPRNTEEDKAELEQLAAEYGLIVTGGTDYHGMNTNTPHPVGTCTTADEQIARIRALAEARKK